MSSHPTVTAPNPLAENLGTRQPRAIPDPNFPDVGRVIDALPTAARPPGAVDVLLVNPPAPDRAIWIRSQHRVGRRSRERMIWPQVDLAQLAALLHEDYTVDIVDAIPSRMTWDEFEKILREKRPRYYVTHVTAPSLTNDMRGTFLARSLGAVTIAFGTHVTPMPAQTLETFPTLDYIVRGEPELTLIELIDTLEAANLSEASAQDNGGSDTEPPGRYPATRRYQKLLADSDPRWTPGWLRPAGEASPASILGLAFRHQGQTTITPDRPYIRNLDDLPLPLHHLLPWKQYRVQGIRGPYTFIVPSRGCPAGCRFCIKHVSYGRSVRVRSPENVLAELQMIYDLGIRNVNLYADLFTVNRDQVMGIAQGIIDRGLKIKWMCNSRVDYVDPEMLSLMARSGCWLISWGIEAANDGVRRRAAKGTTHEKIVRALEWSRQAGIMNWGYFIIGLPGETEATIRETIDFSKKLPLDLALFHIAAPYPGTPFFFEVIQNGWFRPGTSWEEVDMDESTVLDYPELPAERIEYWARRAFREFALRPRPLWTYLKSMSSWYGVKSALGVAWEAARWIR